MLNQKKKQPKNKQKNPKKTPKTKQRNARYIRNELNVYQGYKSITWDGAVYAL